MKATIKIEMNNAAFEGDCDGEELARILRELADRICWAGIEPSDVFGLRDVDGNSVGWMKVTGRKI